MDAVDIRHNGNVYTTHMCGFDRVLWYRKYLQLAQPLGVRQKQWVLTGGNNGIWKESVLWYTHPLVFMTLICPLTRTLLNRWNASSQIQGLGCVCGRCCFCFCSFCFVLFFWCWGMGPRAQCKLGKCLSLSYILSPDSFWKKCGFHLRHLLSTNHHLAFREESATIL